MALNRSLMLKSSGSGSFMAIIAESVCEGERMTISINHLQILLLAVFY